MEEIRERKRLGQILLEKGLISAEQLKSALDAQSRSREFLGAILVKKRYISENALLAALSEQFHMPVVSLKDKYIDWGLAKGFSPSLLLDLNCFPIERTERSITFAITNPLDMNVLGRLEAEAKGLNYTLVLATSEDLEEVKRRYQQYVRGNISSMLE